MAKTDNENIKEIQENITSLDENKIDEKIKLLEEKEKEVNNLLNLLDEKTKSLAENTEEVNDTMEVFNKTKEYSVEKLKSDSVNTGKELSKQKKVTIMIPKSELNPNEKNVPVTINGYTYNILRGKRVEVPEEVSKILEESKYI